jgi:hypothetical protein
MLFPPSMFQSPLPLPSCLFMLLLPFKFTTVASHQTFTNS